MILGDLADAAALLARAIELDPGSADLAYRHARVLEQMTRTQESAVEYCRALALAPDGQVRDASTRLEALLEEQREGVAAEALAALESGVVAADRGSVSDALASFRLASLRAPHWAIAHYNRGVALDLRGRVEEAALAFMRYLELRPNAPDVVAVSRRIGQLQSLAAMSGPSPGVAGALGVLVPGLGLFYAERPVGGVTVLALAGGAVAAGLLVTEVNVRCLVPAPAGERCPESAVVSRNDERPYLALGLGVAAAAGLFGALDAFLGARHRRARVRAGFVSVPSRGPALEGPTMDVRSGRVDLSLIALRFR